MKILIVGATGQLGYAILQKLRTTPHRLTAMYRDPSHPAVIDSIDDVNWVHGDLLDTEQMKEIVRGHDVIISTANAASPANKKDTIQKVDTQGVQHLIDRALEAGVGHFIYTSVNPYPPNSIKIPLSIAKMATESHLIDSGLDYTIIRPATFMDVYFPFFGSDLPLRGNLINTIERPFEFSNNFFKKIRHDIDKKNQFNIIGNGGQKHSYISIDNVADFHVKAIDHPSARRKILTIGGPEPLSPLEIKEIFESLLGKSLTIKSTPPFIIKGLSKVLGIFNPPAGNIMALNYASAQHDCIIRNANQIAQEFQVTLQSAHTFLKEKLNIAH